MNANTRLTSIHLALIALFGGSALLSLLYATDPRSAILQISGIVLAVGLHGLFWLHRDRSYLRWVFALLPLALALGALLMVDWQARLGRYSWLDGLLQWLLLARSAGTLALTRWDTHAIGGILATLLPLQWHALTQTQSAISADGNAIADGDDSGSENGSMGNDKTQAHQIPFQRYHVSRSRSALPRALAVMLCGITAAVALLSGSKAIWAALIISTISYLALRIQLRQQLHAHRVVRFVQRFWLLWMLLGVVAFGAWLLYQANSTVIAPISNGDRISVWHNSLSLARDFAFSGLGFGNYPMAFSSYVLLVHVPFLEHAYNLWLNLWLNQGLLGLLAWIGLLLTALSNSIRNQPTDRAQAFWYAPAMAMLSTIMLYGLFDDPFYGYGGAMLPLLLLPSALLAPALQRHRVTGFKPTLRHTLSATGQMALRSLTLAGIAVVAIAFVANAVPALRASWHANLGALSQMKAELSLYRWPEYAVQDQLRISSKVDLSPAIDEYQQALKLDPANPTANQHLGQIELARSDWAHALDHLNSAWHSDPSRRATRQMLGEVLVLAGRNPQGLDLWGTLDVQQGQLAIREAWYRHILKTDQVANRLALAMQLIEKH